MYVWNIKYLLLKRMDVRVVVQQEFNETTLQIKLTLGKTPCVIFHFFSTKSA